MTIKHGQIAYFSYTISNNRHNLGVRDITATDIFASKFKT